MKEFIENFKTDFKEGFALAMGFMTPVFVGLGIFLMCLLLGDPYDKITEKDKIIRHTYNTTFNTYEEYIIWRYEQIEQTK